MTLTTPIPPADDEHRLPDLWANPEGEAAVRAWCARMTDTVLQAAITMAAEHRNEHAARHERWSARQWNDFLCIACSARDDRIRLRRDIEDAPFTITPIRDDDHEDPAA